MKFFCMIYTNSDINRNCCFILLFRWLRINTYTTCLAHGWLLIQKWLKRRCMKKQELHVSFDFRTTLPSRWDFVSHPQSRPGFLGHKIQSMFFFYWNLQNLIRKTCYSGLSSIMWNIFVIYNGKHWGMIFFLI